MKRLFSYILFCLAGLSALSQDFDRAFLGQDEIVGTARYVGMAGAFTALGGDVSAAKDNPAALGIYRRGEVSVSFGGRFDNAAVNMSPLIMNKGELNQLSWVLNWRKDNQQKGVIANSLMFGYHRLNSYGRDAAYKGTFATSQTDVMADLATGVQAGAMYDPNAWLNDTIGWLPIAGAQARLLTTDSAGTWFPLLDKNEKVTSQLNVIESGSNNEYSVAWGCNIGNRWYVGVGMSLRTITARRDVTYRETFEKGGDYMLHSYYAASGLGWGMSAGMMVRPTDFMRLGLSLHTPTWYTLKFSNDCDIQSSEITGKLYSVGNSYRESHYALPLRTTAGVAFQISTLGLISLEYDYAYRNDTCLGDMHTLKAGTEWVLKNHWFLHAGYAYRSNFQSADKKYYPSYTTTRTDTDFSNQKAQHIVSIGADFRSNRWVIGVSYQFRLEKSHVYLHELQSERKSLSEPFQLNATTHRIVATFAWRYR